MFLQFISGELAESNIPIPQILSVKDSKELQHKVQLVGHLVGKAIFSVLVVVQGTPLGVLTNWQQKLGEGVTFPAGLPWKTLSGTIHLLPEFF